MTAATMIDAGTTARLHELYRWFHAHPELSMHEHRTAERIEQELAAAGIEHFRCGGTGVVGILRNGAGPTVAFRADLDGLPLAEETGLAYASREVGTLDGAPVPVMHGCGHDVHMSVLLAAAALLAGAMDAWSGTIVFVFQPGEETAAGAAAMIDDGLWSKAPVPSVVYGQHVMPLASGTVGYTVGDTMTQATSWKVTIHGRGSHGSQPHESIDPIVLGAHMITAIQTIVSRQVDPREPAVVTIGTFHAGLKENIIASSAEFTVNVRTFGSAAHERILGSLRTIIQAQAVAFGAPEPTISSLYTFPANYNDPVETRAVMDELSAQLGAAQVQEIPPMMHSEDFGSLARAINVPSVYWFVGGSDPAAVRAGQVPQNHSPHFAPQIEPTLTTGLRCALTALLSKVGR